MPAHEIAPPRSKPPVKNTTKEHPHRDERYHRDSAGSDKAASVKGSRHHSIKSSQDYSSDQRSSNSSSKQKVPPSSGSSHHTADRLGQQPQYNNVRDADRLHPDSARTSSRGKEREPSNSSHASPRSTHITPEELDDELAFLELNDGDDPPPSQSLRQSKRRTANNDTTISDYDEKHPSINQVFGDPSFPDYGEKHGANNGSSAGDLPRQMERVTLSKDESWTKIEQGLVWEKLMQGLEPAEIARSVERHCQEEVEARCMLLIEWDKQRL